MSQSEILAQLPKLSAAERQEVRIRLAEIDEHEAGIHKSDAEEQTAKAGARRAKLLNRLAGGYSVESNQALIRLKRESSVGVRSWE